MYISSSLSVSENQVRREAVAILKCLSSHDSYLTFSDISADAYTLMSMQNDFKKPITLVAKKLVKAMVKIGLIQPDPLGRFIISEGGRRWMTANKQPKTGVSRTGPKVEKPINPKVGVIVNDCESPLAWLATRTGPDGKPLLSQTMFDAGERLRRDFEIGQLGARVTASWDASIMSGARGRSGLPGQMMSSSETALCARQRVWRALQAAGPGLSSILLEVCCLASGLEAAERHLKWPKRSAKLVLVMALDRLVEHYGQGERSEHKAVRKTASSWGLADYRPELLGHLAQSDHVKS